MQQQARLGAPAAGSSRAQARATCRGLQARARVPLRVQALIESDATIRVRGNCNAVFNYVSDFSRLQDWHPGVLDLRVTRGMGRPLDLRHQFGATQQLAGFKVNTLYEVVDLSPGKKVVYSCGSDLHVGTEQLVFMPDPNDGSFTMIRYMTRMELTEWRKALTPMVSGILKQLPEKGMQRLGSLLNSAKSPIPPEPAPGTRGTRGGTTGVRGSAQGGGWNLGGILGGIMGEVGASRQAAAPSFSGRVATMEPQVDVLGYYAALGLNGSRPRSVTEDQVKAAFRRAAQSMHPDKFSMADEDERLQAEAAFKKVQVAYEVLRDPQQRKLYDQNLIQQLQEHRGTV